MMIKTELITYDADACNRSGEVPIIECREVVQCRDCIHRASDPLGEYCTLFDFEDVDNQKMLNGFCAWGERKREE